MHVPYVEMAAVSIYYRIDCRCTWCNIHRESIVKNLHVVLTGNAAAQAAWKVPSLRDIQNVEKERESERKERESERKPA